jgi:4-amino-4-deoxy-L-arabinose transferase-like glycosyltransferase
MSEILGSERLSWPRFAGILLCALLAASSMLLFYKLGTEPFLDYDEATYAEVTAESFVHDDSANLYFLNNHYFRKPPLLFWLTRSAAPFSTSPEFSDRLPVAIASFLLIILVVMFVAQVARNPYLGVFAGSVLASTSAFMESSRQVRFDTLVSLFNVLAVYTFWRALSDRRWFLLFGTSVGLAILAKGPIAVFGIVAVLAIAISLKRWVWLRDLYFWGGVMIALILVLPWHIYETLQFGMTFWNEYLGYQVISRVSENIFGAGYGPTNSGYFEYLAATAAPWIELGILVLVSLPFLYKHMSPGARAVCVASLAAILAVLAVCVTSKTKAFSYLIPLYPFLAIAVALFVQNVLKLRRRQVRMHALVILALGLCLMIGAAFTINNTFHLTPYYKSQVVLSQDEKEIGTYLLSHKATGFYTYDMAILGSIMFYSHITKPLDWSATTKIPSGDYVVYQTSELSKLLKDHPRAKLHSLYEGTFLTLAEVVSS